MVILYMPSIIVWPIASIFTPKSVIGKFCDGKLDIVVLYVGWDGYFFPVFRMMKISYCYGFVRSR